MRSLSIFISLTTVFITISLVGCGSSVVKPIKKTDTNTQTTIVTNAVTEIPITDVYSNSGMVEWWKKMGTLSARLKTISTGSKGREDAAKEEVEKVMVEFGKMGKEYRDNEKAWNEEKKKMNASELAMLQWDIRQSGASMSYAIKETVTRKLATPASLTKGLRQTMGVVHSARTNKAVSDPNKTEKEKFHDWVIRSRLYAQKVYLFVSRVDSKDELAKKQIIVILDGYIDLLKEYQTKFIVWSALESQISVTDWQKTRRDIRTNIDTIDSAFITAIVNGIIDKKFYEERIKPYKYKSMN